MSSPHRSEFLLRSAVFSSFSQVEFLVFRWVIFSVFWGCKCQRMHISAHQKTAQPPPSGRWTVVMKPSIFPEFCSFIVNWQCIQPMPFYHHSRKSGIHLTSGSRVLLRTYLFQANNLPRRATLATSPDHTETINSADTTGALVGAHRPISIFPHAEVA
jgi:hypothetical protein